MRVLVLVQLLTIGLLIVLIIFDVQRTTRTLMKSNSKSMSKSKVSLRDEPTATSVNHLNQSLSEHQRQIIVANLQSRTEQLEQDLLNVMKQLLELQADRNSNNINSSSSSSSSSSSDSTTTATTTSSDKYKDKPLPTCESLMKHPNSPLADGSFLTRSTTINKWTLRADGSRELELPFTCRLKRYTSSEARQCLTNRHMSFIGDSLSRYQFISLAYFIERGQYPPRFGRSEDCQHMDEQGNPTCSPWTDPNVCMEGDWIEPDGDSWQTFLSTLGGSTDGGMFHGRFQCSCARRADPEKMNGTMAVDNMIYASSSSSSDELDDSSKVKLSYIGEIGFNDDRLPLRGFNFTDCHLKGTCRTTEHDSDLLLARLLAPDLDWSEPLHQALNGSLRSILPPVDIVIYNRCLWGTLRKAEADKIMPLLHDFVGDGRCFYKTGTSTALYPGVSAVEMASMKAATFNAGCGLLDYGHLTKEFGLLSFSHPAPPSQKNGTIWNAREREDVFFDAVHYTPWVYEELNNILLNVLCNNYRA